MANDDRDTLFRSLIEDICSRSPEDEEQNKLRIQLRHSIRENLRTKISPWKNAGGMGDMSVIYVLPANNLIREDEKTYERLVYGTAKEILQEEGFTYNHRTLRWEYHRK